MSVIIVTSLVVLVIALLYVIKVLLSKGQDFDKTFTIINTIIQLLLLSGVIVSALGYFSSQTQSERKKKELLTEDNWLSVYRLMNENADKCPRFVRSLVYPWQIPHHTAIQETPTDDFAAVQTIAFSIFQSMQNIIIYFLYYNVDDNLNLWLGSFLIWARSETLRTFWENNAVMYDPETRAFIDLLFRAAREHPPNNVKDLGKLSELVCSSEEMRALFQSHNKSPPCFKLDVQMT